MHDELLRELPELRPTPGVREWAISRSRGGLITNDPVMVPVEGDGSNVWLTVPDNADEKAIEAVVLAHRPS